MKLFWQILVYGALAGLIIGSSALFKAHADPVSNYTLTAENAVCSTLEAYPSFDGLMGVMQGIEDDAGFTTQQAATVIVNSVYTRCPKFLGLLQEFAATATPPKAVSAV